MNSIRISKQTARQMAINAQLLNCSVKKPGGRNGLLDIVDQLGYVQIDTISVIQRAHHHVFWARRGDYTGSMLHDLQTRERAVFEYWGHAMSYMPMADFRYSLPRMKNLKTPRSSWMKIQYEKSKHLLKPVLERIRNEGPLGSKDFKSSGKKGGTWWDWKPAKLALELLFWQGELMISERENFHKKYDLTERILPEELDISFPSPDEVSRFLVLRSLKAMGVASERDILKFMQPGTVRDADLQVAGRQLLSRSLRRLIEEGDIAEVSVTGGGKKPHFILTSTLDQMDPSIGNFEKLHILSPFDNLIIQRDRLQRLFDFDFTIECYVPAAKRMYGYFALPILWGDRIIGRLDSKADQKSKILMVKGIFFEPEFESETAFIELFAEKLVDFMRFNNCEKVQIMHASCEKIKKEIVASVPKYYL